MIVGNKIDLEHLRGVKQEDASAYCSNLKLAFVETSALDSTNVDMAFNKIVSEIYERQNKNDDNNNTNKIDTSKIIQTNNK